MQFVKRRYVAVLTLALLGFALYFGIQRLRGSCLDVFATADPPTRTRAEAALFLSESESLYDRQLSSIPNMQLTKPLKADVSGRVASLWVSGPMYAGDYRYAQLWQHIYQRYHDGSPCVQLRLLWKNGSVLQRFPPDTL